MIKASFIQNNLKYKNELPGFKGRQNQNPINISVENNVSDSFVQEVKNGIDSMGELGRTILKATKTKIHIGKMVTDILPELKGVRPRGWPKGMTWDNSCAISIDEMVVFAESPIGNKSRLNSGIVRHEISHELDKLYGEDDRIIDTNGYTQAYLTDIKNFSENLAKNGHLINYKKSEESQRWVNYLIQGSTSSNATTGGKAESFAEILAKFCGGSQGKIQINKNCDMFTDKVFPNVTSYIEKLVYLLSRK